MVGEWPKSRPAAAARSIIFFGLLYLYLWRVVQPRLIYSCGTVTNFPIFRKGWLFFHESLSRPGGLLHYVSALLPQFFYHSWAGALVIVGQAWALVLGTGWLLGLLNVPGRRLLRFVPALLVLAPYARYTFHFPSIMGALVAVVFGCLYIAAVSRDAGSLAAGLHSSAGRVGRDGAVYLLLSVICYVAGAAAFLPFALLCAVYELLYRRRYLLGAAYLPVAAVLPYVVGVLVFRISIVDAYTDMLPLSWRIRDWSSREKMVGAVYVLYLFPIAAAVVWGLAGWVSSLVKGRRVGGRSPAAARGSSKRNATPAAAQRGKTNTGTCAPERAALWPFVRWAAESLALLAVGAGVAFVALDRPQKALLAVHDYACRRMWPEVLEAARRCPDNYTAINAVDRALYHTGRFERDLFTCLQYPEALVITGDDHSMLYWHKFDTLLDLGLVNLAEKNLTECMETFGAQPMILQRLALVNLVKGKLGAARIYLGALHKTLFFSAWADDYLARLAADPTLASDAQIRHWRAQALQKDATAFFFAREPMLAALAGQGTGNRMAFEYLMGWYLINKQLDKFVQGFARLREFGYTEIPPLYQEAALIFATRHPIPLSGYSISREAKQRIKGFSEIFNRYGRDKAAAFSDLAKEYAGSYFLYFIYAATPAGK